MSALGIRCLAVAVCVAFGFAVVEAAAGPAEIAQIKPRQDKLRDMGGALKAITDELKKGNVDWDNTIPNAQTIKDRSAYLLNWFPKGSGSRDGQEDLCLAGHLAEKRRLHETRQSGPGRGGQAGPSGGRQGPERLEGAGPGDRQGLQSLP